MIFKRRFKRSCNDFFSPEGIIVLLLNVSFLIFFSPIISILAMHVSLNNHENYRILKKKEGKGRRKRNKIRIRSKSNSSSSPSTIFTGNRKRNKNLLSRINWKDSRIKIVKMNKRCAHHVRSLSLFHCPSSFFSFFFSHL